MLSGQFHVLAPSSCQVTKAACHDWGLWSRMVLVVSLSPCVPHCVSSTDSNYKYIIGTGGRT